MSEIRAWATENVGELQRRPGDSLRHKLRQRGPQPEPRYYKWLRDHEAQIEEMTTLAEALRDIYEMVRGDCVAAGSEGGAAATTATSETALATTSPAADVTTNAQSSSSQLAHPDAPPGKKLAIADPTAMAVAAVAGSSADEREQKKRKCAETAPQGTQDIAASSWAYFEKQDGAWCGMHALNNYLGGPIRDAAGL